MRRTLTVLVASAALLVPASAASAAQPVDGLKVKTNASCSNGKGGNGNYDPLSYNGNGNTLKAAGCVAKVVVPETPPVVEPVPPPKEDDKVKDNGCTVDIFGNKVCSTS